MMHEYPGGVLFHTGLPNPGLRNVAKACARAWSRAPVPVIAHLMADRPDETREMVRLLEGRDNILAVELGFAPLLADDVILLATEMSVGELPVIVNVVADQLLRLATPLLERGAAALSVGAPRGAAVVHGRLVTGRLLGPSLLPVTMNLVEDARRLGIPLIAAGGIGTESDAALILERGALAIEMDLNFWVPTAKTKSPVD
jgi:dihydroorotate dehydrogenase